MNRLLATFFILNFWSAFATNYYVNDASTAGDLFCSAVGNNGNSGTSSSAPKATLTNLLATYGASLTSGDTVFIDAGTYTSDINFTLPAVKTGISFVGAGYQATIFDNQLAGSATNFFMYIRASNTHIANMSFTGYQNNGTQTPGHSGQAITIGGTSGSPVTNVLLENISFYNNGASGGNPAISILSYAEVTLKGGGSYCNSPGTQYTGGVEVYGDNTTLTIEDYILSNNYATAYAGAGLRITGGNNTFVNVKNTQITDNVGNEGAGIAQFNGNLHMTDCVIDGNTSANGLTHYGAGFRIACGTAQFNRCVFTNNSGGTSCRGAGIAARYSGNTSAYSGDPGFSSNKTINITIDSCLFQNNSPGTRGMDIYGANGSSNACTITAVDCQFLTPGNYNIFSDATSPASAINVTYFGTIPTSSGSNVTRILSGNTLYTPTPSPPLYSGTCGSIVILPIELIEFKGACIDKNSVLLNWATATENNNDEFIIEEFDSYNVWKEVARVNGAGTSTERIDYKLEIEQNKSTYYRLKQLDFNGRETTYQEIFVRNTCATGDVVDMCYFKPESNELIVKYHFDENEILSIQLFNAMGQLILTADEMALADQNELQLSLPTIANGIYLVAFSSSQTKGSSKIYVGD